MSRRHVAASLAISGLALGVLAAANPSATAEGRSTASGRLEVLHEDDFTGGHSTHRYRLVEADGQRTELLFDDRGPEGLGGRDVRVTGTQVRPGVLRVGSSTGVAETGTTAESAAATTTATKRVAVILLDFSDSLDSGRSVTPEIARDTVFNPASRSVNMFLSESSFAQLQMVGVDTPAEGDVFGWVRIAAASTDACDFDEWGRQARAAATPAGFNDADYDQVIHLMPKSTCTFGGVAYMPGKYSWTVLRGPGDPLVISRLRGITSHEYGHSLGIHHAGSYACTANGVAVRLSSSCTLKEYGDPFSVMGMSTGERQYHGYQKGRLGWLATANTTTVTATGQYALTSISSAASGPQVLRIARPRTKGSSGEYFYVELRQPSGAFDNYLATDAVVNGVSIRLAPDYGTNAISKLLDMAPGTPTFDDAALPRGDTFTDTATGIAIRLDALDSGVAQVHVTVPATRTRGSK